MTQMFAALVCVGVLAGCTTGSAETNVNDAPPQIVTTAQSERLAVMRFNNFNAGTRALAFSATDQGTSFDFAGWFDYESATGYGALTDSNGDGTLIVWTHELFGAYLSGGLTAAGKAPSEMPDRDAIATAWNGGPLDPSGSALHSILGTVAALGNDRPENPLLLQQAGTLWLGDETVDDVRLTGFAGPASDEPTAITDPAELVKLSTLSYWVNEANLLLRAELRLGGGSAITTVNFGDAEGVTVPSPFPHADASEPGPSA